MEFLETQFFKMHISGEHNSNTEISNEDVTSSSATCCGYSINHLFINKKNR